jgi:hypothetical protein
MFWSVQNITTQKLQLIKSDDMIEFTKFYAAPGSVLKIEDKIYQANAIKRTDVDLLNQLEDDHINNIYKSYNTPYSMIKYLEYKKTPQSSNIGGSKHKNTKQKVFTKTTDKVTINNCTYTVYLGKRGGKYIKKKGEYISIKNN